MTIDRLGSVDPLKNISKTDKASVVSRPDRADSIEVSSEAKAQAEIFAAREAVRQSPEIRMERVAEIKAKLQDPNYLSNVVMEGTAEGILKSFGI